MKNIILLILILVSIKSFAQEPDKTVSITVSGIGKTQDEAKQSALRSAIEQAFGAFISSKTEILNDQVVADQMASVSAGNIQSFTMLNESQLPDGSWASTLRAIVSVNKLTKFVQSKGIAVEIKGGVFAINIKQQSLNELGEINTVRNLVGLLHEQMQLSFDFNIISSDPKSLDANNKNWEIPLTVTAITNNNIDICANYLIKTLSSISLSENEIESYKRLNKAIYRVEIFYKDVVKSFYLRKQASVNALATYKSNWNYYTRTFTIQSGLDELNGTEISKSRYIKGKQYDDYGKLLSDEIFKIEILTSNQKAATFSWQDKRTISQIEKMSGYVVKPTGVISHFKHGGFVVYEHKGHGFVTLISDLDEKMNWENAKTACEELESNGYDDWELPSENQFRWINGNLIEAELGNFHLEGPYILSLIGSVIFHGIKFKPSSENPNIIRAYQWAEAFGIVRPIRTF